MVTMVTTTTTMMILLLLLLLLLMMTVIMLIYLSIYWLRWSIMYNYRHRQAHYSANGSTSTGWIQRPEMENVDGKYLWNEVLFLFCLVVRSAKGKTRVEPHISILWSSIIRIMELRNWLMKLHITVLGFRNWIMELYNWEVLSHLAVHIIVYEQNWSDFVGKWYTCKSHHPSHIRVFT